MPEAVRDPFFVERGMIIEVDDPIDGRYRGVSSAMFFSDATSAPSGAAPLAGEHSRELLEQLGYDADKVESLLDRAVVQHPAV